MFNRIRIVLLQTSHPGNIGSAARAMKTMGLSRLYLVKPKFFPDPKAVELASGASDVLEQAVVVESLQDAIADCRLVIGTSARVRELTLPLLNPHQCAEKLEKESASSEVALIFGSERTGITAEEFEPCHYHVVIPANSDYNSLNLGQAVQLLCYEIRMAHADGQFVEKEHDVPASAGEIEQFYQHLQEVLLQIKFLQPDNPRRLMPRLKRMFSRIRLEEMEVNLLRGMLSKIEKAIDR